MVPKVAQGTIERKHHGWSELQSLLVEQQFFEKVPELQGEVIDPVLAECWFPVVEGWISVLENVVLYDNKHIFYYF